MVNVEPLLVDAEPRGAQDRRPGIGATMTAGIGSNTGTGGSSGLRYLRAAAKQLFEDPMYPELWDVRSEMFSRPQEFDLAAAGYGSQ